MACAPTTLGARYSNSILTEGRIPEMNFAEIIKSQQDPSSAYNRQTLLDVTGKLNKLLPRTNLSNFPFLDSRRQQTYIFYPEIADFLNQSGYDIDEVSNQLEGYEIVINQNPLFDNTTSYIKLDQDAVPGFVQTLFGQMEFYYSQNMANTVSGGFCSALSSPFTLISKILAGVAVFTNLQSLITDLQASFAEKSLIDVLKDKLEDIVTKVKAAVIAQFNATVTKFTNAINRMTAAVRNVEKRLKKMRDNIEKFFSEFSIENILNKIGDFIDDSIDGFEELDGASIALLLFRFCQFAETIQSFIKSPVDGLLKFGQTLAYEEVLVTNLSMRNTKNAVRSGAVRLDDAGIKSSRERILKAQAKASAIVDTPPPTIPLAEVYMSLNESGLSASTLEDIRNLTENGIDGLFEFSEKVKAMGADEDITDAQKGDGWRNVDRLVWIKLANVANRQKKMFTITRAYTSALYSRKNSGVGNSLHMSDKVINVSTENMTADDIKNFVRLASQEGFLSIYSYDNYGYIQLGIGSRSAGGSRVSPNYPKAYLSAHSRDEFRKGARTSS